MTRDMIDVLIKNLWDIYYSESESLRKKEFKNMDGSIYKDPEEVISLLTELDLIETEVDPDQYFLIPETYELLESGESEYYLLQNTDFKEDKNSYEEAPENWEEENLGTESKSKKSAFGTRLAQFILYLFLGILITWVFYGPKDEKKNKGLSPELLENLKNVIIINENGDTLNARPEK